MNKKQKSSIILASLASIAVAGSLIAGSTYALFTSESKTNIAVTSGTVDVSATISDFITYTGKDLTGVVTDDVAKIKPSTDYDLQNGQFANGGTAVWEDGSVALSEMTPGDKVTFKINVKNNSNVAIKYRTIISFEEDTGLYEGLTFDIDGTEFNGLSTKSAWTEMAASGDITTLDCVVDLRSSAGNEYQGTSCKVSYTVEAVQGNAKTTDPVANVIEIDNASQLGFFRNSVNKDEFSKYNGKTVKLTKSIDLNGANWTPIAWDIQSDSYTFTFDGGGNTISNFKVDVGDDGKNCAGFFSSAYRATIQNLTIDKATIVGTSHVAAIAGDGVAAIFDNCHVTNSSVTCSPWLKPNNEYDDGDKAGAIVGYFTNANRGKIINCSASGNKITAYRDLGGLAGSVTGYSSCVKDNEVLSSTITMDLTIISEEKDTIGEIVGRSLEGFVLDTTTNTSSGVTITKKTSV